MKINYGQLRSGRFFVNLPGGGSYEAVRQQLEDFGAERFAWVGHAEGDPQSRVVIGVSGTSVVGIFAYGDRLYRLRPNARGEHELGEIPPGEPAPEHEPLPVADTPDLAGTPQAGGNAALQSGGSVIDILVAYTPAVAALYGGATGADALIIQAVAEANQAYVSSKMSTRLQLKKTVQTSYVESGSMNTDLSRLKATGDGHMDELHALRNGYGADVVSLIENEPQYCGIAYRMTNVSASFATSAFSVVHHSCATGYYSFAHEIAHNQGAHHDHANASGAAVFPYAYGYQDPGNLFRTIMAYNCPGGCSRIQLFSGSDNLVYTLPTGIADYADNARAIDETAPTVAAFRAASALPPAAPSGLSALAAGIDRVNLNWSDTSIDETNFLVERSIDGLVFTQVASLPASTNSYLDTGLLPDTLYNYRVRAQNGAGYSGYSNVAVVTTAPLPEPVDYFAVGESTAMGIRSGSAADTQLDDGVSESITEVQSSGPVAQSVSQLQHYWAFSISPGEAITLRADVAASGQQSFTFAYSTTLTTLEADPSAWVDMFSVSASNSGARQFRLPKTLSGLVIVSVRDNDRTVGKITADAVSVDYLTIRAGPETELPPGC